VVDQDTFDSDRINLPMQQGDQLLVGALKVLRELPPVDVPSGLLPPMLVDALDDIELRDTRGRSVDARDAVTAADLDSLRDALRDLPECRTAAEQMAGLIAQLRRPIVGDVPVVFVSQLARLDAIKRLVRAMCDDAQACVAAYNAAVQLHPGAGVPQLTQSIGGGMRMVELPLWVVMRSSETAIRERVYYDIDAGQLIKADWREIDIERDLVLPRALMLTALMRTAYCDLFIHGTGGGVYDRITENWLHAWQGEQLAPMAVVSANEYLAFDAPVADRDELKHAIWFAHHLPHNVDRNLDENNLSNDDAKLIAIKRDILAQIGTPTQRIPVPLGNQKSGSVPQEGKNNSPVENGDPYLQAFFVKKFT
jgi:hypothetical protein